MKKSTPSPTEAGLDSNRLVDLQSLAQAKAGPNVYNLVEEAEALREKKIAQSKAPKRNLLILSGGGSYGAFQAGVLRGWADTGCRPDFDVITGVSTGALLAAMTFPGQDMDQVAEAVFTSVSNKDIFTKRNIISGLASGYMADTKPLREMIDAMVNDAYLDRVAGQHSTGKRLYVGTTNLGTRRQVIWDMGEIATKHRTDREAKDLYKKVLLASAAIPGYFPPVTIPVEVNGKRYEEKHVDGGVTAGVFIRPPALSRDQLVMGLAGSEIYCLIAGKLFADPGSPGKDLLSLGTSTVAALLSGQVRDELAEIYLISVFQGMRFNLGYVPEAFPTTMKSSEFNKTQMRELYALGRRLGANPQFWRHTPPGVNEDERPHIRGGTHLYQLPPASRAPDWVK